MHRATRISSILVNRPGQFVGLMCCLVVVIVVVYAGIVAMGGGETDRLEKGRRNRGLLDLEAVEDLPFFEALGGRAIVCGT